MQQKIMKFIGLGTLLFALLVIGGWALMLGIGSLFALAYRNNKNRGSLLAAMTFIGLGFGLGIEAALAREGGVAIMLGLALGFLLMTMIVWMETRQILWGEFLLSIAFLVLTSMFWSYSLEALSLYLSLFPFGILILLVWAAYLFWYEKKQLLSKP